MSIDLLGWRDQPGPLRLSVEQNLSQACDAKDPSLSRLAAQAVAPEGHRMRAAITLAGALQETSDAKTRTVEANLVNVATATELVHIGAVTHDDVIDEVAKRGDGPTVNASAGSLQAILAGDFLMARASEYAAAHGTRIAQILAETIGWICEGRARQLRQSGDARPTVEDRIDTIEVRHASLFSTGAIIGALAAGQDPESADELGRVGLRLGRSIAIHDEVRRLIHGDPDTGAGPLDELERQMWTLPMIIGGADFLDRAQSGTDLAQIRTELLGGPCTEAIELGRDEARGATEGLPKNSPLEMVGVAVRSALEDLAGLGR